MVMVIYHYVERIWIILVTPDIFITYTIINKYYLGEPVNIHIQSLKILPRITIGELIPKKS